MGDSPKSVASATAKKQMMRKWKKSAISAPVGWTKDACGEEISSGNVVDRYCRAKSKSATEDDSKPLFLSPNERVQKLIYESQHPAKCDPSRQIYWKGQYSKAHSYVGIGGQLATLSLILGMAISEGKVLVILPKSTQYANAKLCRRESFECAFMPLTPCTQPARNSSRRELWEEGKTVFSHMKIRAHEKDIARRMFPRLSAMFKMSSVFAIQRALVAYIMRPNARLCGAYAAAMETQIEAAAWRGLQEDLAPRVQRISKHVRCGNYVTVHMRFGDKDSVNEGPNGGDNVNPYYNALQRVLCSEWKDRGSGQASREPLHHAAYPTVFYSTDEPRAEAKLLEHWASNRSSASVGGHHRGHHPPSDPLCPFEAKQDVDFVAVKGEFFAPILTQDARAEAGLDDRLPAADFLAAFKKSSAGQMHDEMFALLVNMLLMTRGRRLVGWLASNWPRMVMLIMSLNGLERSDTGPHRVASGFDFVDIKAHATAQNFLYQWPLKTNEGSLASLQNMCIAYANDEQLRRAEATSSEGPGPYGSWKQLCFRVIERGKSRRERTKVLKLAREWVVTDLEAWALRQLFLARIDPVALVPKFSKGERPSARHRIDALDRLETQQLATVKVPVSAVGHMFGSSRVAAMLHPNTKQMWSHVMTVFYDARTMNVTLEQCVRARNTVREMHV